MKEEIESKTLEARELKKIVENCGLDKGAAVQFPILLSQHFLKSEQDLLRLENSSKHERLVKMTNSEEEPHDGLEDTLEWGKTIFGSFESSSHPKNQDKKFPASFNSFASIVYTTK